ncbi:MAG: hypothetical protein OWQ54_09865 [Sulfolobaceae archaeon]|nr:hypothetical protein [Sulfolobaceae archaeon]
MRVIDSIKVDRTDSCGERSPLFIIIKAIEKIKECGEAVEILMNDYDWYVSLKYILQIRGLDYKVEDKGKQDNFMKVQVIKDC